MANYTSNLKTWGSVGEEFPNGYSYLEGEQPVDAWDNFTVYNAIEDIKHLIDLTNDRLESTSGTAYPASPEPGHLTWRTDTQRLAVYDDTDAKWHGLMKVDGDTMEGPLDMGGFSISNTGDVLVGTNEVKAEEDPLEHYFNSRLIPLGVGTKMISDNPANSSLFEGARARGTSEATAAPVGDSDRLVSLSGLSYIGNDTYVRSGDVSIRASGPPEGVNGDIVPGAVHVRTRDSNNSLVSRMVIDQDGQVDFLTGGVFIQGGGPNGTGEVKFGQGSRIYENSVGEIIVEDSAGNPTQLT